MKSIALTILVAVLCSAPVFVPAASAAPNIDPGIKHTPSQRTPYMPGAKATPAPLTEPMPGANKATRPKSKVRIVPPTSKTPKKTPKARKVR